jgi:peptidoglycan/LPS O-acetylase OafA/YrhL
LISNQYIAPLIILSLFIAFPVLVFDNVLADYVNKYLMGDERLFGLIESSYAAGALLAIFGATAVSYITRKTNHSYILILILSITYCAFGYISNTTAIMMLTLLAGLLGISLKVVIQAKIQNHTDVRDISRVQGFALFSQNISAVIILVLTGLLSQFISSELMLACIGVFTLLGVIPFSYSFHKNNLNHVSRRRCK